MFRCYWNYSQLTANQSFGLVATLLEMIPVASIFFTYTNTGESWLNPHYIRNRASSNRITVGAALWAADIESMDTSMTDGTAPALRESADKLE